LIFSHFEEGISIGNWFEKGKICCFRNEKEDEKKKRKKNEKTIGE